MNNCMKLATGNHEYKYLFKKLMEDEIIDLAFKNLKKGKTKRKEIIEIEANYEEERERMKVMIWNTRPSDDADPSLAYCPKERKAVIRHEHGKERKTYEPEMHEQWLHHIIVLILKPIIEKHAYPYSCGSLPKKGAHFGMRHLRRMIKRGKGIKYFLKLDIRHFFESTSIDIVIKQLKVYIDDEWLFYIIRKCYEGVKGLVLGFYLSQWLANYVLEPLDHLIVNSGFDIFVRYMDDVAVFSDNKRKLRRLLVEIRKLLGRVLRLKVKKNYTVQKFDFGKNPRCLDFMGFKFYRNRVTIRKRIMTKATRLAARIDRRIKSGERVFRKHLQAMISYLGWFKWTDSYNCYLKWIKPHVNIRRLKNIVSRLDRREQRIRNERILKLQTAGS